jgi:hypothetical protein
MKGKTSCMKKPLCNQDFMIDVKSNQCIEGFTAHNLKFDKDIKCNNSNSFNETVLQLPCNGCPRGYFENDAKVCKPCTIE